MNEFLSEDEQWERLNLLLIILAVLFLYFATFRLAWPGIWINKDNDVIVKFIVKKETITLGKWLLFSA